MIYEFSIKGRLPGLNEYTEANRTNPYKGGKMKADSERIIIYAIREQFGRFHIEKPVKLHYLFVEPNGRRDLDNISSFALKVIQDSLVKTGILTDDGQKYIKGFTCNFAVDKGNPHIEVRIEEV